MKGFSYIYSFPFRVYGKPFLPVLAGSDSGGRSFRLYPPFRVRAHGTPLSPTVPFGMWPSFEWHPRVPAEERLRPPQALAVTPLGERGYDAIRLDGWGADVEKAMQTLIARLFAWWRHSTGQPWIGHFESQTDPLVKATFTIDGDGRALKTPWIMGKSVSAWPWTRLLTEEIWRSTLSKALSGDAPPTYWQLWLDADNYRDRDQLPETILSLALSLEVARDTLFPRFAATRTKGDSILLEPPFDGTDLLTHLDEALQSAISRSLRAEKPELYAAVKALYVARHGVAHGKTPLVNDRGRMRTATLADVMTWYAPVREVLLWLEALPSRL